MAAAEDSFQNIGIWADSTIHQILGARTHDFNRGRSAPPFDCNENRAPGNTLAPCEIGV